MKSLANASGPPRRCSAVTALTRSTERPMRQAKPDSISRRQLVKSATAAAALATAAVPAVAATASCVAVEPDPIYRLLAEHRKTDKAWSAALNAAEDAPEADLEAVEAACDAACLANRAAEHALVEIGPTTAKGWARLLRYEAAMKRTGYTMHGGILESGELWEDCLLRKLAAFLDEQPT